MPSVRAKSVSSRPRPTLRPGRCGVPTCRTRMVPVRTTSPPKRLTPRYCGLLSRPFRDEPCPFLCAIINYSIDNQDPGPYIAGDETGRLPAPIALSKQLPLTGRLFGFLLPSFTRRGWGEVPYRSNNPPRSPLGKGGRKTTNLFGNDSATASETTALLLRKRHCCRFGNGTATASPTLWIDEGARSALVFPDRLGDRTESQGSRV